MSFDMFSFFVIGATNFGERDGDNSAAGKALDRDYSGYMFHAGVNFALDMATIRPRPSMPAATMKRHMIQMATE
jgi:hypothetical protein